MWGYLAKSSARQRAHIMKLRKPYFRVYVLSPLLIILAKLYIAELCPFPTILGNSLDPGGCKWAGYVGHAVEAYNCKATTLQVPVTSCRTLLLPTTLQAYSGNILQISYVQQILSWLFYEVAAFYVTLLVIWFVQQSSITTQSQSNTEDAVFYPLVTLQNAVTFFVKAVHPIAVFLNVKCGTRDSFVFLVQFFTHSTTPSPISSVTSYDSQVSSDVDLPAKFVLGSAIGTLDSSMNLKLGVAEADSQKLGDSAYDAPPANTISFTPSKNVVKPLVLDRSIALTAVANQDMQNLFPKVDVLKTVDNINSVQIASVLPHNFAVKLPSATSLPSISAGSLRKTHSEMLRLIADAAAVLAEKTSSLALHGVLGRGAYGVVYLGTWRGLMTAIKRVDFLTPLLPAGDNPLLAPKCSPPRQVVMEAALTYSLIHPNIVSTYHYEIVSADKDDYSKALEVGPKNDLPTLPGHQWRMYLVQEYCDGGSLCQLMDCGRIQEVAALINPTAALLSVTSLLSDIGAAMEYCHAAGVLHGDLNPNNVLLQRSKANVIGATAKVADFGLSVMLDRDRSTVSNTQVGTWCYMAPERFSSSTQSRASDVYSFGVMMWELVSCERPWLCLGPTYGFVTNPRIGILKEGTPLAFALLIQACIHQNPLMRPSFTMIKQLLQQEHGRLMTLYQQDLVAKPE